MIIVDELKNRALILNSRPNGFPDESNFKLIEFDIPEINLGEFIVKILWLSVDPYMRGRMSDKKSYAPSVEIGDVMVGGAVGKIISSRNLDFEVGDLVVRKAAEVMRMLFVKGIYIDIIRHESFY